MSRIGRMPVTVPAGVDVKIDGPVVTVKGPKGTLTKEFNHLMKISQEGTEIIVSRPDDENLSKSLHGLTRTLTPEEALENNGVGFRCEKQGKKVVMNLGFSHKVEVSDTDDIKLEVPAPNKIVVTGIDKQKVGQMASEIRGKRPPEPDRQGLKENG